MKATPWLLLLGLGQGLGLGLLPAVGARAEPLAPFFDAVAEGPADPAPPAPALSAFDRAVLDLCGGWGDSVDGLNFIALLRRFPQERESLTRLASGMDEKKLSDLWFREDGFRHIFCGDPGQRRLGGMHWAGRYLQAQEEGWAGRLTGCRHQEIAPPVYTLGLRWRRPDGSWGAKCPGGYAVSESASSLLTRVTAEAMKAGRAAAAEGNRVCLGTARHGGRDVSWVVVTRNGAIVTAYPDVTPPNRPACGD